jgi:hypothetical protein
MGTRKVSTLAAGTIAAGLIACSNPGLRIAGGMMHDAGNALAGAGAAMAGAYSNGSPDAGGGGIVQTAGSYMQTAGLAISNAGDAVGDAGRSGNSGSSATAQESSDGLPRAHWILRDKAGTPIKAEVYPALPATSPRFIEAAPSCASVNYLGTRNIGLYYVLATGKLSKYPECPGGILSTTASWRDYAGTYYMDSGCSGAAYTNSSVMTAMVNGVVYYSDPSSGSNVSSYYTWSASTSMCTKTTPTNGATIYPFKLMPDDIINLLTNPPYSMELVY